MKVTLIAAMSLDGFIAESREQSSLRWTSKEDTAFFMAKSKEIGTLIVGRTTFDTFKKPLPDRRTIVVTRDAAQFEGKGIETTALAPAELMRQLEEEGVQEIAIIGGASVYSQWMDADLVDELWLTIEPLVFGRGIKLFDLTARKSLQLISSEQLNDQGTLLMHYRKNGS